MPTLNWLTREADLQKSRRAPYRLLEPVPELGYGDPVAGNLLNQGDNRLKALLEKITAFRQRAYEQGYQETLFGPRAAVETSYLFAFDYPKDNYPARWPYKGAYQFGKHYYQFVGELEATGEEFECARAIDGLREVKHWVRNLAVQSNFSFWLPTSTDRFYPDFVAELEDGRTQVVEYKGEHILDAADMREKRNLGALWELPDGGNTGQRRARLVPSAGG